MRQFGLLWALAALLGLSSCGKHATPIKLSEWEYHQIDSTKGAWFDFGGKPTFLRYFGLVMDDLNGDGFPDIISGRYWYRNPGNDLAGKWERIEFGVNADAVLTLDTDGDGRSEIIGESLPKVYLLKAIDQEGRNWDTTVIASIPRERHRNGQGFRVADIFRGGYAEILLASEGGIYCIEVPEDPKVVPWPATLVAATASAEGFDLADVDGDGDLDIVAGDEDPETRTINPRNGKVRKGTYRFLKLFENPGHPSGEWVARIIGTTIHDIDRLCAGDLNGDGMVDIVVSEERYPGEEKDAHLYWFRGSRAGSKAEWDRFIVSTQYSLNNLDLGDIDLDGDLDIVTAEHKGPDLHTLIFQNDGSGAFNSVVVDKGKESHLGTQLSDLDKDGDLDIVSIGWDHHQFVHVWENLGIR